MAHILKELCPSCPIHDDKSFVFICAWSKKKRLDLVELLLGTYNRQLINFSTNRKDDNQKSFTVQHFIDNYPLFQHYKRQQTHSKVFEMLSTLIPICHKRFFGEPCLDQIRYKIQDEIDEFIQIQTSVHSLLQGNVCVIILFYLCSQTS